MVIAVGKPLATDGKRSSYPAKAGYTNFIIILLIRNYKIVNR